MYEKFRERPTKVTQSYTQKMVASAKDVFPLLCPIRELDWVEGWPLQKVFSESGFAELDCVFLTRNSEKENSIWIITRHEPENFLVEMVKTTASETVGKLQVNLKDTEENMCDATVAYTFIALNSDGKRFVEKFTSDFYKEMMQNWEQQINKYLRDTYREFV